MKTSEWVETDIKVSVHLESENPIYGENATHVSVDDEAGGPFVVIEQAGDYAQSGTVRLDPDELDLVFSVAMRLLAGVLKDEDSQ